MNETALVDGVPVPCVMARNQVLVLFPRGLAGLRAADGEREFVFPDSDGVVRLTAGAAYTLAITQPQLQQAHLQPQLQPLKERSGMMCKGARQEAVGSWAPIVAPARVGTSAGTGAEEEFLFRPPGGPAFLYGQYPREAMRPPSALQAGYYVNNGNNLYNVGDASSITEGDMGRQTVEFSGDLFCSPEIRFNERPGKLIQDRVHEYVFLPMIAIRIVDTLEFQRLRTLKQLGTAVYLYPGATHTRFEHSIGVAHLASEMVNHISICQPELGITRADILCVTIAGLCHDIGHGPFSHLFEHVVNRIRTAKRPQHLWHHEEMSVRLLRRILSRLNLSSYGLNEEDALFMELCISGLAPRAQWPNNVGRPPSKRFLVDIVANKRNGIDVDKLDYFLRDSLGCYGRAVVDVHIPRLLSACKVMCFEGEYQICFEEKMALSLGEIFNVRAKLHKHAYQHRIVKVTDYMVSDALYEADPYFKIRGKDGRLIRMSECVEDEEGFCQLGDWVWNAIAASGDSQLARAQAIIKRINERDLYTVVGMALFARYQVRLTEESIREEVLNYCFPIGDNPELRDAIEATLIVSFITITFGSSDEQGVPDDPINHVTFYNPKNMEYGAFKLPKRRMSPLFSPSEYGERLVIVMVRDRVFMDIIASAFDTWKERNERHLGVAVPTHNMRKEESPGKGSALARRITESNSSFNGEEFHPNLFQLSGNSRPGEFPNSEQQPSQLSVQGVESRGENTSDNKTDDSDKQEQNASAGSQRKRVRSEI
ncbi:HD domain [Trypanosoma melophagium]|uniref:HD domain n=1 Tax=Trypanosoma melophagium TaxID=715481 RepID=UPI00351A4E5C|nr:HD domain [Trypanosoma melophagium]